MRRKMERNRGLQNIVPKLNNLLWMVLPLLVVFFSYFFLLGKDCVFEINDQLDETLFTYVLNGKYLFSGVKSYPEMLGGVPKGGMSVSACLFIPLYKFLPVFQAFMIQYIIVVATAYVGMYLCVKELTGSEIIGFLCGGMFMFLPYQPVYGLSVVGGPLVFYAFLCLYKRKHVIIDRLLILYFALGANLVLLGYVALGFVFLADIWILVSGKKNKRFLLGSLELLLAYILINFSLFSELFLGGGGYVSHREEMVITGNGDFWGSAWDIFLNSGQHAFSYHRKLILPILAVAVFYGFRWKGWKRGTDAVEAGRAERARQCRNMYIWLVMILAINVLTALFYGFCQSDMVVDFRNSVSGFFHYFSPQRVYWIYPTAWYVAAGLAAGLLWKDHDFLCKKRLAAGHILAGALICVVLVPTAWNIRQNSIWILNKSQYKNNRSVGLMSWADYFAEDLMREIDAAIFEETGRTKEEYRVASLGMCPAVALEAGFYCIDGYSNNYSLEYKHEFREIIAKELEKCPGMKAYFDDWGSRCYLFTEESQNYYYLAKDADFRYEKLELDVEKMKELGGEYLFSAAEIEEGNARRMGLELFGVFETEGSYYEVWVYEISGKN